MHDFSSPTWNEALREFLLHVEATRAAKTHRYYRVQLSGLITWANTNTITFESFGKRHLDRYLVERQNQGKAQITLHHDAICAKAFFKWCSRNDFADRSPLADYEIRNAPRPPKYMPTDEDMRKLLIAVREYWDVNKNPIVRYEPPARRTYHRDRNYAVILGLIDSACRIGEMLSFKRDDYDPVARQVTVRESKGRESRVIPVSREWATALDGWLKIRTRVAKDMPKDSDEGWLFLSEFGTRVEEGRFLKSLKKYAKYAGASDAITLHSLRRYSLNKLSKENVLVAQRIAGHKETKTTLLYTEIDADHLREVHEKVSVVRGIITGKRTVERRKRLI